MEGKGTFFWRGGSDRVVGKRGFVKKRKYEISVICNFYQSDIVSQRTQRGHKGHKVRL